MCLLLLIDARRLAGRAEDVEDLGLLDRARVVGAVGREHEHLAAGDYDIAFADPPYRLGLAEQVARLWLATPFARVLGIEHEKSEYLSGSEDRRVYGDTVVTFYRHP